MRAGSAAVGTLPALVAAPITQLLPRSIFLFRGHTVPGIAALLHSLTCLLSQSLAFIGGQGVPLLAHRLASRAALIAQFPAHFLPILSRHRFPT